MGNKVKNENDLSPTPPLSQARLHSLIPDSSTSSSPELPRGMGNGGCDQSVTAPLCHAFLHELLPCCSLGPLHRPQFLRGISTCSGRGPPWLQCGYLLQWDPLQGLQGNLCSMPGAPLPLLLHTLVLEGLFLTLFFPYSSQLCSTFFFFSFLTHAFPEVPPSCLRGSAVPCREIMGAQRLPL